VAAEKKEAESCEAKRLQLAWLECASCAVKNRPNRGKGELGASILHWVLFLFLKFYCFFFFYFGPINHISITTLFPTKIK